MRSTPLLALALVLAGTAYLDGTRPSLVVSELRGVTGGNAGRKPSSIDFLAWWDADPVRELLDGTRIDKYGASGDLFGDWREEVGWPTTDNTRLRIHTTREVTDRKLCTLLHDVQYRTGLAWQNTAYNQPPHPSFFLGSGMSAPPQPQIYVR